MEINNYQISVKEMLEATNGRLIIGNEEELCSSFCRDSREIKEDDVYLGIKGENINGSKFFAEAFEKGAKGAILQDIQIEEEQKQKYQDKFIIIVEDTVKAMQEIATLKRNKYNIPVVAVTGSVGKTSTKDLIASVMSEKYLTLKTQGNYNNHIGVPMTIFSLRNEEAMVVEMGMNHLGEISILSKIAQPQVAVITNVGTAHIGILGSRENILKAKLEILEGMQEGGIVVINNDNDLLHKWYLENKEKYNIITYGVENESDCMAENIKYSENGSTYILSRTNEIVEVPVGGEHFVLNSLCAIAIGKIYKIPLKDIIEGIKNFELTKKRMDIEFIGDIMVINDYYNANYDSMKAALNYLGKVQNRRKIAILGDMLELGEFSKELHEKVGEEVVKNNIDLLITVGKEAKHIAGIVRNASMQVIECDTNEEAIEQINKLKHLNDCILLKASNGMHFGEILDGLKS